jgi:hypothetical protein
MLGLKRLYSPYMVYFALAAGSVTALLTHLVPSVCVMYGLFLATGGPGLSRQVREIEASSPMDISHADQVVALPLVPVGHLMRRDLPQSQLCL